MAKTGNPNGEIEADLKYSSRFQKWAERNEVGTRIKSAAKMTFYAGLTYGLLSLTGYFMKEDIKLSKRAEEVDSICCFVNSNIEEMIISSEPVSRDKLNDLSSKIEAIKTPLYKIGKVSKLTGEVIVEENSIAKSLYTPEDKNEQQAIKRYLLTTRDNLNQTKEVAKKESDSDVLGLLFTLFGISGLVSAGYTLINGYRTIVPKREDNCPAFKP